MRTVTLIVSLLAVFISASSPAQTPLFDPVRLHYPVTGLPWSLETGDFNNDGHTDFVTASRLERSITLRLGNGDGTFGDSINASVGISPRSLIPGDFNSDTFLDVAVANLLSNDVTVLLGDGTGSFPTRYTYPVGDKPRSIITTRFNGDPHLDLAVANRDANSISILLGNGDGTFAAATTVATTTDINPRNIRSGFINGDTLADIAVIHDEQGGSSVGQKFGVILGRGDGSFDPIQVNTITAGNGFPEAVSLTLAHFDGDANLDMVVSLNNSLNDEIVSYQGNGDGTFTLRGSVVVGGEPFNILHNDLDADGFPDIIVSNTGSNRVTLHTNRGDGTFRNPIPGGDLFDYRNGTFRVGYAPRWITMADVDGDGRADLLSANEEGNDVSIHLRDTDTTFVIAPRYNVGSPPQAFPSEGVAVDFNDDSNLDLAITNWGLAPPADVSVLLGNGDGTFLPKVNYPVGRNPDEIIASDFDGDAVIDLAVLNSRDSLWTLLPGNPDGTFDAGLPISIKSDPAILRSMTAMAAGDFNEDGRDDIVIINYNEDYLALFLTNTQTIFDDVVKLPLSDAWPERLVVADFNRDGHADILVQKDAQYIGQSNALDVFFGDGSGGFDVPIVTTWTAENTSELISADIDADGNLDLAILDSKFQITSDDLIFFRGNGDGTFTRGAQMPLTDPNSLLARDVVGDAHLDLLVGSFTNADVKILEGGDDFTFVERWPSYGVETGIRYFAPGDFDNDGDLDLATTGGIFGESFVSVMINVSNRTGIEIADEQDAALPAAFRLEQNFPNPFNPETVIRYQLNRPGAIELTVYNALGQTVRTLVRESQAAGRYQATWDGRSDNGSAVASGVYVYQLRAGNYAETRKMVLLR